jgi:hypothetical protein
MWSTCSQKKANVPVGCSEQDQQNRRCCRDRQGGRQRRHTHADVSLRRAEHVDSSDQRRRGQGGWCGDHFPKWRPEQTGNRGEESERRRDRR